VVAVEGERLSPIGLLFSGILVFAVSALCIAGLRGFPGDTPMVVLALGLAAVFLQLMAAELPRRGLFSSAPALTLATVMLSPNAAGAATLICLSGLLLRSLVRRPAQILQAMQTNLAEAVPEVLSIYAIARGASWAGCAGYVVLAVLWPWIASAGRLNRTSLLVAYGAVGCAAVLAGSQDLGASPWRLVPMLAMLAAIQHLVGTQFRGPTERARPARPDPAALQAQSALQSLLKSQENERLALQRYQHEHQRLEEELQRLQSLLEGTRQLASTLDLAALGERLEAMLRASIPHDFGAIFTLDQGELQLRRQWGAILDLPAALAVCHGVLSQDVPLRVEAGTSLQALVPSQTALLAAPMQQEQGTTGVLLVGSTAAAVFAREHQDLLWLIGCLAAISFANAGLHQEVVSTQAQLVHAGKLAAIGQLAAGVAHELNTPLGAIQLAVDGLSRQLKEQAGTVERKLERARLATNQAREIVDKLLVYSRRDIPADHEAVHVSAVLTQTLQLVETQFKRDGVQLQVEVQPVPPVLGSSPELRQVLTNLLMNARDAALSPGASAAMVKVQVYSQDGWVLVQILDRGPGVSPELERRIFEPFFTTKPVGRGTGLGLSISHRIAAQHGGSLEYAPAPGGGACFTLRLPTEGPR
jgi:signal transduction histidine kinase